MSFTNGDRFDFRSGDLDEWEIVTTETRGREGAPGVFWMERLDERGELPPPDVLGTADLKEITATDLRYGIAAGDVRCLMSAPILGTGGCRPLRRKIISRHANRKMKTSGLARNS